RAPIYKSPHVDAFSVFTYLYIVWFFYAHLLSLLHYLEKYSTWVFVWYRLAMGIFLVVSVVTGFLPN
ncbi:MAG: hypothetical protein V7K64_33430, partial [Nostoc sp.]